MIVSPDKFQAIVFKRSNEVKDSYSLNINQGVINSENCVKLLGVENDSKFLLKNILLHSSKKQVTS